MLPRPLACCLIALALPAQAQDAMLTGQATMVTQWHGRLSSPYQSDHSLQDRAETRTSYTSTLFGGWRPFDGLEVYADPELAAGRGVSGVEGLAGFPNGEIYRVGDPAPRLSLARLFARATWSLGADREAVAATPLQLPGTRSRRRLALQAGKFALNDLFDTNAYSGDPRGQFLNWALMNTAAWDYPADTRGYTWGLAAEFAWDDWTLRGGRFLVPLQANGLDMDHAVAENHGDVVEAEHRHEWGGEKGSVRTFFFANRARMGSYREALGLSPAAPDITTTRREGRRKHGWGLNADQALGDDLGLFLRTGWNDGATETWAFTEVDRSAALGLSLAGGSWGRPEDRLLAAWLANGLSPDHRDYLAAGGQGFLLGDGRLSYGLERIVELTYVAKLPASCQFSLDLQRVWNPGCNRDRGPALLLAARLHVEF